MESNKERAERIGKQRAVERKEAERVGKERREKAKHVINELATGPRLAGKLVKEAYKMATKKKSK